MFRKKFSELKIKVALNWFELVVLFLVSLIMSFELFSEFAFESILLNIAVSVIISIFISWLFCCFRKYQFTISRFDKEDIYKKISEELIAETKDQN